MTHDAVARLDLLAASGVWAVRSTSPSTAYVIDTEAPAVMRRTGPESSRGPADNVWVPLAQLSALPVRDDLAGDDSVVRVGARHLYVFVDGVLIRWWVQRSVTVIERLAEGEIAGLPPRLPGRT